MFGLGPTEILVILVVILVFFGAKGLPAIGRGLGRAIREFQEATRGEGKVDSTSRPPREDSSSEKKGLTRKIPGLKEYEDVKDKVNKVRKITRFL